MRKFILCLFVFVTACSSKPADIQVGDHKTSVKAVSKRADQVRLLRPAFSEGDAAASIVEGWVADAVLQSRGKQITDDELSKERARLEGDKQIARLYREVAKIYGDEVKMFLDVGLLPDMAMRRASEVYQDESAASTESQELAAGLLRKAQAAPEKFAEQATASGASVRQIIVTADGTVKDDTGHELSPFAPHEPNEGTVAKKVYTIAQGAKPGTMLGLVLRTPTGHLIAKRLGDEKGGGIRLEAAVTRNTPFAQWLQAQAKALVEAGKLRVCINDENVRTAYLQAAKTNLLNCPAK